MDDLERKIRDRQIKVLEEEIEENHRQWESAISDEQRLMFQRRIDQKLSLIKTLQSNGNWEQKEHRDYSELQIYYNTNLDAVRAFECGYEKEKKGKYQQALIDYTEAIRLQSTYIIAYARRGVMFRKFDDRSSSLQDFHIAMSLSPYTAEDYLGRGIAKYYLGDEKGSIADYSEAIRLKPNYAAAYYSRGNAKDDLGDKQGAFADYTYAIYLKPDYSDAYFNRGTAHFYNDLKSMFNPLKILTSIRDFREAARLYQQTDTSKDCYEAKKRILFLYIWSSFLAILLLIIVGMMNGHLFSLVYADILYKFGNKKEAIEQYESIISRNPKFAQAYYNRGYAHKQVGKNQEALEDFQKAAQFYQEQGNTEMHNNSRDRIRELGGG